VPNSNTAALFAQANVVKIEIPGLGSGQGTRLGEEAFRLDRVSGGFDRVIVRGMNVARALDHKSVVDRTILYMVGAITPQNTLDGKVIDRAALGPAARAGGVIFQNEATRRIFLASLPLYRGSTFVVPPSVDEATLERSREAPSVPSTRKYIL